MPAPVLRALFVALALSAALATEASARLSVKVLSTRADLVSANDALVQVRGVKSAHGLRVTVNGKRRRFTTGADGRVVRLVRGLRLGRNVIIARRGKRGARLIVTNHPKGGPVLAGPQLQPWKCQASATDKQCNQPASYTYSYKPTSGDGFKDYDPENPPSDVATTTTDQGVEVPFIVRIETGYIDRDQYKVAALYQPGQPWSAVAPQPQFNHKLLITHGAACGVDYEPKDAPEVTTGAAADALGRGFAVMSTALDNSGHNCNLAVQAESLIMTKEHVVERYGTLRYTIGTGCSGGSLALQWISNAYPGVYQGILPTCSFPDAWSTATQFLDYHNSLRYFMDPSLWGPGVAWLPTQMAAVQGHVSIANSQVSDNAQFHVVVPTDPCDGVTDEERYDPQTNPGGVQCTIQAAAINLFGPRPQEIWTAPEKQVGHGFAGTPVDNVGVQYGLKTLLDGTITPAQFVDLNAKMGGLNMADASFAPERLEAVQPALRNAYRTGMINSANNLDRTAIIDCRGPDPGAFHDAYRAFAVRARLDREHGDHDNQVIWEGPVLILADTQCEKNSLLAMDEWLAAVEQDTQPGARAAKLTRNKPATVTDRCYDGAGHKVADDLCGEAVVPVYSTPRMVAGDALTTDANKCQLKPLDRSSYGSATFSDTEWTTLQQVFPNGVCDFSKPGVDQQGTVPWQTYQDAKGAVVYGGKPLGAAPKSRAKRFKKKRASSS